MRAVAAISLRAISLGAISLGAPLVGCPRAPGVAPPPAPAQAEGSEARSSTAGDDEDGDGARSALDDCPGAPVDSDGHLDRDGCPDVDRDIERVLAACRSDVDGDGVSDVDDACPSAPETYDGLSDDDGCPDAPLSIVTRDERSLRLEPRIGFEIESRELLPASRVVLDALASFLRLHPRIRLLEVQGHLGEETFGSRRLDRDRAHVVVDALMARGISRERLEPRGYRFTVPLPDTDPRRPDRRNWRIELVVLEEQPCLGPDDEPEHDEPRTGR